MTGALLEIYRKHKEYILKIFFTIKFRIWLTIFFTIIFSMFFSICLSICFSIYLSIYFTIYFETMFFTIFCHHIFSICLSICFNIYFSICLSKKEPRLATHLNHIPTRRVIRTASIYWTPISSPKTNKNHLHPHGQRW